MSPPPVQEILQYYQVGLAQSLMRSPLFCLGSGAQEILCAPSKSGVSVSPSPVEFLWSNPAGLQSQIFWGLLPPLPDPQAGKPDVVLRTFTPVGEPLWYNYFTVCWPPTQCVCDLILLWLHLSCHLAVASLDVGYLFCYVPAFFLSMVVQQLVVILLFP